VCGRILLSTGLRKVSPSKCLMCDPRLADQLLAPVTLYNTRLLLLNIDDKIINETGCDHQRPFSRANSPVDELTVLHSHQTNGHQLLVFPIPFQLVDISIISSFNEE